MHPSVIARGGRWRRCARSAAIVRAALAASAVARRCARALRAGRTGAPARAGVRWRLSRCCWPRRRWLGVLRRCAASPADAQVARFIEERAPALDDRLVSAVDVAEASGSGRRSSLLAGPMLADAARASARRSRRRDSARDACAAPAFQAAAAALVLARRCCVFGARTRATGARRGVAARCFPRASRSTSRRATPASRPARALTIQARLVGNRAPVVAQLQIADGDDWRRAEMADGRRPRRVPLCDADAVSASFKYRVVAGARDVADLRR